MRNLLKLIRQEFLFLILSPDFAAVGQLLHLYYARGSDFLKVPVFNGIRWD